MAVVAQIAGNIIVGSITVDAAGTPEPFAAATDAHRYVHAIEIEAFDSNTAEVYLGNENVGSTIPTTQGMDAGETKSFRSDSHGIDLNKLYLDADANGMGANFYAVSTT